MPVSQRSATIAERLGYDLILLGRTGFRRAWTAPLVYPLLAVRMVVALLGRRPGAAVVAVPPFIAPLVGLPVFRLMRTSFAVDVHSGALLDRRWRWSIGILAAISRRAVVALVTLPSLEEPLRARGVETLVLPDPLPHLVEAHADAATDAPTDRDAGVRPLVVAICGWGLDEPIEALVESARDRPWRLVLTGRPRREIDCPLNVTLTGFLDAPGYGSLLADADAIVVLTDREDTLLSGAWEAISLGRPLVLSGTQALRATFGDGLTYVDNDAASIAAGIGAVLAAPDAARTATAALRTRFARENDAALGRLAERLNERRP